MVNLYFNNSRNEDVYVAKCEPKDVMRHIQDYINSINSDFVIYYTRIWSDKGKTWFDVGSHTEFFFVDKDIVDDLKEEDNNEREI